MKTILTCFLCLSCSVFRLSAQNLYRISLDEKVQRSSLIVEGKVISQKSFWNPQHTMIFTSSKVEVSKIFKGSLRESTIEVVTQGGSVGSVSIEASDLLELSKDQAGVFFCLPNAINLRSPQSKGVLYDVYSSAQGFLNYDLATNTASAPFAEYRDITNQLYPELVRKTGIPFRSIKTGVTAARPSLRENGMTAVSISSFSPATVNAGALLDPANNVLTINGSGFGTPSGAAAIFFDNADNGTGGTPIGIAFDNPQIISWSDNQIQVRVPTKTGTGTFMVRDASGNMASSPSSLNVLYSILTASFDVLGVTYIKESNLMDANGSGGYDIVYCTSTAGSGVDFNSSTAKQTFQRALATWREISGYNVAETGTTAVQSIADDGINVIMFDNANTGTTPLPAGTLATCYSYNSMCGPDFTNNQAQKTGFDIVVRNTAYSTGSTAFTMGPCPPNASGSTEIDLETVLLHELGHSMNLGHINDGLQGGSVGVVNPGKLMHYSISNSVRRITPDYSAKAAASYALSPQGNSYSTCGLYSGEMTPLATTAESRDECPASFPSSSTPQGTVVTFDLAHATSNRFVDPAYTQIRCDGAGASQTNNAYYAFKTGSSGSLLLTVNGYNTSPSSLTGCTQLYAGVPVTGVRLAVYQANSCPTAGSFPAPVGCATITGDGSLSPISGLTANTNYLLYAEGIENTKANFSLTFGGSLLPIKFSDFSGKVFDAHNELNWKADAAVDVEKMIVQKSTNGTNFENLGEVTDLNKIMEGTYRDHLPYPETFYRLAIVNTDRSMNYSGTILLKRKVANLLTVYPNPSKDDLNIQVSTSANGAYKVELYNSVGQLVRQKTVFHNQTLILPVSDMASGVYRLTLFRNNEKLETHTVVKQ
ncbi:MAG TPA: T9SS type A sorting domain-containing protein [Flavisolibacter sp.]|nr:T9SS type A sorting domain-containing protein [Flavisolibacter sp.]